MRMSHAAVTAVIMMERTYPNKCLWPCSPTLVQTLSWYGPWKAGRRSLAWLEMKLLNETRVYLPCDRKGSMRKCQPESCHNVSIAHRQRKLYHNSVHAHDLRANSGELTKRSNIEHNLSYVIGWILHVARHSQGTPSTRHYHGSLVSKSMPWNSVDLKELTTPYTDGEEATQTAVEGISERIGQDCLQEFTFEQKWPQFPAWVY
jgi:hypothetical protein